MSSEKRLFERKPLRLELNYRHAEGGNFLFEYATNISRGGIFIETRHPLPRGASLLIRFSSPEGGPEIDAEGIVAWVNDWHEDDENPNPGMGIQWIGLSDDQRQEVTKIVRAIAILPED